MTISNGSRVLFVVALLAIATFALIELPRRRDAERAGHEALRLFAPFTRTIDRIDLIRPGSRVRLELRGGQWEVVMPTPDRAEHASVATLIDALAKAEVARNLGPAGELAQYGLVPPVAIVTLAAAGDTLAHVELGASTVDLAHAFARRRDGDIVLVPPSLISYAALPASAFRDQRIVHVDVDDVAAFSVHRDGHPSVRWSRRNTGAWFTLVAGDTVTGDSLGVPSYLRRFRGMRVRAFVETTDTARAFDRPAGSITFYARASAPQTLRFAARPDGAYWSRKDGAPRVVEVDGDVASALDASPAALRDRRLIHFSPPRAKRIQIATADTSAVLVRAGTAWGLPNPALGRVDPRAAADFVRALRALRFERVVDAASNATEPAALSLTITAAGDTLLDDLRGRPLGDTSGDWVVTSRSSGMVATVPAREIDALIQLLRRVRTAHGGR